MTAGWLKRMGYPHVAVLEGGVPAWERSGRPLERGQPAAAPAGYEASARVVERVAPGDLGDDLVISVDPSDVYQRAHLPGATWIAPKLVAQVAFQIGGDVAVKPQRTIRRSESAVADHNFREATLGSGYLPRGGR